MLGRPARSCERGQVTIITVFVVFVFLGLAALAVDVGNWFVHHRHLQTQVDAAALASAQDFTGCFLDPALTNPVIRDTALQFAGDLNRVPGAFNRQVQPVKSVHVVLNSASYWPDNNGVEFNLGQPCVTKFLDVKATDDDTPSLFGIFDFQPDIRARARLEIRKADSYTGILPWAIPEVDPGAVVALFVNEATGQLVGKAELTKGAIEPLNGTSLQRWGGNASVTVPAKAGVVIMTSQRSAPDLTPVTLAAMCAQSGAACYRGASNTSGLALVRGLPNGAAPSATNPVLNGVQFGAGTCTDDSGGWFVSIGDCEPAVSTRIDFGVSNPVVYPTFARVFLQGGNGSGCSAGNGCPMVWSQSTDTWVLDPSPSAAKPTLSPGSGPTDYDIFWQTGGAGPGSPQVAANSLPSGSENPQRSLATTAQASSPSITVTKSVSPAGTSNGPWGMEIRLGATVVDSFSLAANESHTTEGLSHDVTYTVVETTGPAGFVPSYGGKDCNTSGRVTTPRSGNAGRECTVTNTRQTGTLRVIKNVVGGSATASQFTFTVTGAGPSPATFPGTTSGQNVTVTAGQTYTLTESGPIAYTASYSPAGCDTATVPVGTTFTCTVTNTAVATGSLVVSKTVTNNNTGTRVPGDWTIQIRDASGAIVDSFPGAAAGTDRALPAGTYTVTESATPAGYTLSYPAGTDCNTSGSVTVVVGQTRTCTLLNDDNGAPSAPASGIFSGIARPYAKDDSGGPVEYLLLGSGSEYFFNSLGPQTIRVDLGLTPLFLVAGGSDAPISLRFGQGSRTQLIDCDKSPRGPDEEIRDGCFTRYKVNATGDCSAYGFGSLPPTGYDDLPTPTCVSIQTGTIQSITQGIQDRFENPCTPNNWSVYRDQRILPPSTDKRYVVLVITDYGQFSGGGTGNAPVRKFAAFYVTGWGGSTGCPGNDARPGAIDDNKHVSVWGHFVNTVEGVGNGEAGPTLCAFNESSVCIGVLVE